MGNVAGEQGLALQQHFPYKPPYFFKIQTVIKSHLLMMGASNFDILRHAFSISGICYVIAHNFMKSRSRDGLAAKGLFLWRVNVTCCHAKYRPCNYNNVFYLVFILFGNVSLIPRCFSDAVT